MAQSTDPTPLPHAGRFYSRAELLSDAIVHIAALALAIGAVPVLITLTALWEDGALGTIGVCRLRRHADCDADRFAGL